MNEQANKVLAELLQKAVSGIDQAVAFSQAQVPDVIHQLLVWEFVYSFIMFLLAAMSVVPVVFLIKRHVQRVPNGVIDRGWDRGNPRFVRTLIWDEDGTLSLAMAFITPALILYFVWLICVLTDLSWLKIWLAPKLYLLEYAAHLIK